MEQRVILEKALKEKPENVTTAERRDTCPTTAGPKEEAKAKAKQSLKLALKKLTSQARFGRSCKLTS